MAFELFQTFFLQENGSLYAKVLRLYIEAVDNNADGCAPS